MTMSIVDRLSFAGCWLLGQLFVWAALNGFLDQWYGADPRGYTAFAQLMMLALLCAFVVRSYQRKAAKR